MICPNCGEDRHEKDFLGKAQCYKCIYQEKTQANSKTENKICKECKKLVEVKRTYFCSDKCMQKYHSKKNKLYWFRVMTVEKVDWKKNCTIKFKHTD